MFVAKSYLKDAIDDQKLLDMESFKNLIGELLPEFFSDKPLFKEENISLYYFDEYVLGTCVTAKSVPNLYLEINQPNNVKKWNKKEKRHTYPELYISLNTIRDNLLEFFIQHFDSNTLMWQDKFGINFSINLYDETDMSARNVTFRLIPCITYENEQGKNGVMYFNEKYRRDLVIEYPELAIKNFKKKNKQCLGLYKPYCIMFKNIFKAIKNEQVVPSEIYETILYNVPNLFFENYSLENLNKIINYIRNSNILNYKTLDEQDYAFVTSYRPMNLIYVRHAIKKLEAYIKKLN